MGNTTIAGLTQALALALALGAAQAAPLTLTELHEQQSKDATDGIGYVMQRVWRNDIVEADERAYAFAYAIFDAKGARYLVSSFRSADCRPNECEWRVDRLTPSYSIEEPGKPFTACGTINQLDVTDDRLTICGQAVQLP